MIERGGITPDTVYPEPVPETPDPLFGPVATAILKALVWLFFFGVLIAATTAVLLVPVWLIESTVR